MFRSLFFISVLAVTVTVFAQEPYRIPESQSAATFTSKQSSGPPQPDAELRRVKDGFTTAPIPKTTPRSQSGKAKVTFADELEPQRELVPPQKLSPRETRQTDSILPKPLPAPPKPVTQTSFQREPAGVLRPEEPADNSGIEETDEVGPSINESAQSEEKTNSVLDKPLKRKIEAEESEDAGKKNSWRNKLPHPNWNSSASSIVSVGGSLLIVLSAFFLIALLFKKISPKSSKELPKEAFENLGRVFLTAKQQLHLLRLGNRLVLVSVTQDGVSPVSEVTEPEEVLSLLGMCRRLDTNSSSEIFRKMIANVTDEEINLSHKKRPAVSVSQKKSRDGSLVDLYSEPDESLAEILAKGVR